MAADPLFGWDMTYKIVEKDIKSKSDIIIAFIHWNLTKRGFRCIGIGDEGSATENQQQSELLATGWNSNENYSVRYKLEERLYILHGVTTNGNLIVNLVRVGDMIVSNLILDIDSTVTAMNGPIDKLISSYKDLMFKIKRDLIESITSKPTSAAATQTTPRSNSGLMEPLRNSSRFNDLDDWNQPPAHFGNIGRADLDPFAPAGSGMLFNPFQPRRDPENPGLGIPGGLPRGAVPPGARFDPFGPLQGGRPGRRQPPPDADHFPPPGFDDNMFL